MKQLLLVLLVTAMLTASAVAAFPQTKPHQGTLCAAKYKGRTAIATNGVRVRCTAVTRYQWKVSR